MTIRAAPIAGENVCGIAKRRDRFPQPQVGKPHFGMRLTPALPIFSKKQITAPPGDCCFRPWMAFFRCQETVQVC
jgi:hypothetical protein